MADHADIAMTFTLRALGAVVFDSHYNAITDEWSVIDKARLSPSALIGRGKTKHEAVENLLDLLEMERRGKEEENQ